MLCSSKRLILKQKIATPSLIKIEFSKRLPYIKAKEEMQRNAI